MDDDDDEEREEVAELYSMMRTSDSEASIYPTSLSWLGLTTTWRRYLRNTHSALRDCLLYRVTDLA